MMRSRHASPYYWNDEAGATLIRNAREAQRAIFMDDTPEAPSAEEEPPARLDERALAAVEAMQAVFYHLSSCTENVKFASQTYHNISKAIVEATHYDAASVCLYENDVVGFQVLGYHGLPEEWEQEVKGKHMYLYSKEWADGLRSSNRPLTYRDLDTDPVSQINMVARSNTGGIAVCPISLGSGAWGIVTYHLRVPHDWEEPELRWVTLLSRHVQCILRNEVRSAALRQRLYEQNEALRQRLSQDLHQAIDQAIPHDNGHAAKDVGLTERERDVLTLVSRGATNSEICRELYISESTVKKHVHSIFKKLGVKNRTQAARYAKKMFLPSDQ